jgi:hypothetical protein
MKHTQKVLGRTNCLLSLHYKFNMLCENLRGCIVGMTEEKYLSTALGWFRDQDIRITFMTIGSGIELILVLMVFLQQFEGIQCSYYWTDRFMMYTIEMASRGMIHLSSFAKIGSATVCEAEVLALLTRTLHVLSRWNGFMWHDIHTNFHEDW